MKKITKAFLGFLPVITFTPALVSCSKVEEIKYTLINAIKADVLKLISNVEEFFGDVPDQDVVKLKNDIKELLTSLRNERISKEKNLTEFLDQAKAKFKKLVNDFVTIRSKQIELVQTYFVKYYDFSKWVLNNLIDPKYNSLVNKIKNYFDTNEFNYTWENEKIEQEINNFNTFIISIKQEKGQIDNATNAR
ncbi:hypothetical protein [Mycoplasmopsis arginini]|uniref:Lipoprotein n=1 Tax=Mycoplasmopsis arginini TaxID=2094 RepID=A0AA43QWC4_MYCAR|nr:hypothetical protein [Mycoplasmopsis arginini]MDI3349393.1 hypothetical protein [Mycoplasmopsis arginini]